MPGKKNWPIECSIIIDTGFFRRDSTVEDCASMRGYKIPRIHKEP